MYCIAGMLEAHSTKIPNKLYRTFSAQEIPFIIREKLYPFYWFFWHNFDPTFHHKKQTLHVAKKHKWKKLPIIWQQRDKTSSLRKPKTNVNPKVGGSIKMVCAETQTALLSLTSFLQFADIYFWMFFEMFWENDMVSLKYTMCYLIF